MCFEPHKSPHITGIKNPTAAKISQGTRGFKLDPGRRCTHDVNWQERYEKRNNTANKKEREDGLECPYLGGGPHPQGATSPNHAGKERHQITQILRHWNAHSAAQNRN